MNQLLFFSKNSSTVLMTIPYTCRTLIMHQLYLRANEMNVPHKPIKCMKHHLKIKSNPTKTDGNGDERQRQTQVMMASLCRDRHKSQLYLHDSISYLAVRVDEHIVFVNE